MQGFEIKRILWGGSMKVNVKEGDAFQFDALIHRKDIDLNKLKFGKNMKEEAKNVDNDEEKE